VFQSKGTEYPGSRDVGPYACQAFLSEHGTHPMTAQRNATMSEPPTERPHVSTACNATVPGIPDDPTIPADPADALVPSGTVIGMAATKDDNGY
jgi:hypothetical protein